MRSGGRRLEDVAISKRQGHVQGTPPPPLTHPPPAPGPHTFFLFFFFFLARALHLPIHCIASSLLRHLYCDIKQAKTEGAGIAIEPGISIETAQSHLYNYIAQTQ